MSGTVRLVPTGKDSSGRESILDLLRSAFRQAKRPLSGSGILPSRPRTIRFILCRRGKSRQTMRTGKTIVPTHATSAQARPHPFVRSIPGRAAPALFRALSRTRPADQHSSQHDSVENGLAPTDGKSTRMPCPSSETHARSRSTRPGGLPQRAARIEPITLPTSGH